jgi:DNA adenine methylase
MEVIKPFVKWAGGKGSLISQLTNFYPFELENGTIKKYVEPFVGGGAVLIDILQKYDVEEAYAFDINKDLINCYNVIKQDVETLIEKLNEKEKEFLNIELENRQEYFYKIRSEYNSYKIEDNLDVKRASEFIFLNRTCFNGLYRVNKNGEFNVPCGKYKNPTICDAKNLRNLSKLLQNVVFEYGDYKKCFKYIDTNTFVYFDPPYRPLSITSGFTSYTKEDFNDENQKELADFYKELDLKNAKLMLSNSNPKNTNKEDNFFEDIYKGFNINEVSAKRMINSKAQGRGEISELLITNYKENNECIQENSILKMVVSN